MEQKVCPSCNASNTASAFYCAVCQTQINGSEVKENETFEYNRSDKSYLMRDLEEPISIGSWIALSIGLMIPIVGLIILLVLLFGQEKQTLKNYAIAQFIMMAIGLGLGLVMVLIRSGY